jgi:hypothetical protein
VIRSTVPSARAFSMRGSFTATRCLSGSAAWKSTCASFTIEVTGMWLQPQAHQNTNAINEMERKRNTARIGDVSV